MDKNLTSAVLELCAKRPTVLAELVAALRIVKAESSGDRGEAQSDLPPRQEEGEKPEP